MNYLELVSSGWLSERNDIYYLFGNKMLSHAKLRLWYRRTIRRMKMKALKEEER